MKKINIKLHLGDLPDNLDLGKVVAIDTETMGLDLRRDRLCLVQLYGSDNETAHLVQITKDKPHPENLVALLADTQVEKLFHYARFDLAVIYVHLAVMCQNIFCTKIASKLARTYTNKHGLADLCKTLLKEDIEKKQQTSDWGSESLSKSQQEYAAYDVLYLHDLKEKLVAMLARENRLKIAQSCFQFLPTKVLLDTMGWDDNQDIFWHGIKR